MTTPAGWYDDGSGRQRWWDGQQWTEHFAPEADEAAPEAVSDEQASDAASLDDTVVRADHETVIVPETDAARSESPASDPYSPPAPPAGGSYRAADPSVGASPSAAPALGGYPGAVPSPGSPTDGQGYPGGPAYAGGQPEGPKKPSILGLVGLGLAVLGTILVFIPVIGVVGFFLLAAAFIVSLISLFRPGKKWPGITGLSLSIVGTILGIIMFFVYLGLAFAQGVSDQIDDLPSSSPSISAEPQETEGTDGGTTGTGRPTVEEVAAGLTEVLASAGQEETYTAEQITCIADGFVASDISDETLQVIAGGEEMYSDADAMTAFSEQFTESGVACLTQ